MNNKELAKKIVEEAYENYFLERSALRGPFGVSSLILSKEQFINECKADSKFSDKWELKIEERELSLDERYNLMPSITGHSQENIDMRKKINNFQGNTPNVSYSEEWLDSFGIPTKQITLTYKNEIIESYEYR